MIANRIFNAHRLSMSMFIHAIVLMILLSIGGCKQNYETKGVVDRQAVARPVRISPVEFTDEVPPLRVIGKVSPNQLVKLSFKTGGVIENLNVREGQIIKKGQLIATLRMQEINAQVLKASSSLDKTKRDLLRTEALHRDGAATLENIEDLQTLIAIKEADLEIAEFNRKYSKIISPVSGRLISKLAERNELIAPGSPVVVIADEAPQLFIFSAVVSDKDISRIAYRDKVSVSFDAFEGRELNGVISTISEMADRATGTFVVEIELDVPRDIKLRTGLIGRATIYTRNSKKYAMIPTASLAEGQTSSVGFFVYEESTGTARRILCQPDFITTEYIYVSMEYFPQRVTHVLTTGIGYVADGDKISIVE